jgi:hypothetical protein
LTRLAIVLWAAVLAGVCVKTLLSPRSHSCYPIFAGAARNWVEGLPLYSPGGPPSPDLDCYRYSPLIAVLLVPLGLLPDPVGGVLWRLLNGAAFLGGLAWWSRAAHSPPAHRKQSALPEPEAPAGAWLTEPEAPARAWLALLVLPLAIGNLHNGQANLLVLGLLLAAMAAVAQERWTWAATCTALACLLKVYPLALGLLLATRYPRAFGLRLAGMIAVGLLMPFALQDSSFVAEQYQSWFACLRADDRSGFPVEYGYRDFQHLCRVAGLPISTEVYRGIQVLAGAALAGLCLAGQRAGWERRRLLRFLFGGACCWMTLFGPATESCTYVLIGPALAWAMVELAAGPRRQVAGVWLGTAYSLLLVAQAACWFPGGRSVQALGLQPLAALVLVVYLVLQAWALNSKGVEQQSPGSR